MLVIRRAASREWEVVREVRLAALQDAPDWFWATFEQEVDQPPKWWRDFVAAGAWFIAWKGHEPVGIAAAIYDRNLGPATRQLISMWVAPDVRGEGVGERLVSRVKAWAQDAGIEVLQLEVTQGNIKARRLYERCGFRLTGRTMPHPRNALLEELEMRVVLSDPPPEREL